MLASPAPPYTARMRRVVLLACLTSLTAWAGGLDVPLSRVGKPPFAWDIPKVVDVVQVQGELSTAGIPVKAEAVRTHERPDLLLRHIVQSFVDAGFYLPPADQQVAAPGTVTVTALDADTFTSYTAILQPGPGDDTTVILSRAFLNARDTEQPDFAPLFPGAREVAQSRVQEAQTLTYSIADPKADVLGFYRKALSPAYRELSPGVFQGPNDRLEVYTHPEDDGLSVAVIRRLLAAQPTSTARHSGQ